MHRRREKNEEPMMGTEETDKRKGVRSNEGGREGEMEGGEWKRGGGDELEERQEEDEAEGRREGDE